MRVVLLTCLSVLLVALPAAAGGAPDAIIEPGDTFHGVVDLPGDVDVLSLGAVRGTWLEILVKPVAGSLLRPAVALVDDTTGELLVDEQPTGARRVVRVALELPSTGTCTLTVQSADGTLGAYSVVTRGRLRASLLVTSLDDTLAAGEGSKVSIAAARGYVLRAVIRPARGSAVAPQGPTLVGPAGPVELTVTEQGDKLVLVAEDLQHLGTYVLSFDNPGGAGEVRGRLRRYPPKNHGEVFTEA